MKCYKCGFDPTDRIYPSGGFICHDCYQKYLVEDKSK